MTADLLAAAAKLDDAARFRLAAGFTVARDSAGAQGHAALAEFYNEVAIVFSNAQHAAAAEHRALDDVFTRVIGVEASGRVEFGEEGGAE